MRPIRIFISSPADVQDERERARGVVHQLRRRYAGRIDLRAIFWEDLPLKADMSFQQGIDMVLSDTGVDIAVFILWSRLGSPTGPLIVSENGRPYRSGTEREWHLMLNSREACRKNSMPLRPDILVYSRQDEVSFEERLRGKPDDVKMHEIDQKRLASQFIKEEFSDAETGTNIRAYHSFDQPTTFAQQLRIHLTILLDTLAGNDSGDAVWSIADYGSPYRGLDVFEFEHAPIFCGREDEIVSVRTRLREQARHGCAFVLICGPSGSGKSSLARAGVLPDICSDELDSDIRQWRWLAIKPSEIADDLLGGLLRAMTADDALPELKVWASDIQTPSDTVLFREWLTRLVLRVGDALNAAGGKHSGTRLILLVDQLEELFSDTTISSLSREQLFETLEVLARSGRIWVLATVRSDFYQDCQTIPALIRLKEGTGWFDLLPPTADAFSRIITGPALMSGLRFESEGGHALSDLILRQTAEHRELLPLIEHLLWELCERRSSDGMLTFAEFRRLGGVEGALRQRCENTFNRLSTSAQGALAAVLSDLVTIGGGAQPAFVRRTIPLGHFDRKTAQRELVDAMVAARLFTTSQDSDGTSVVSVAHEALLAAWPRISEWIESNQEHLRLRARVEQTQQRWEQQKHDDSLLLPVGLPLNEARSLLLHAPHLLSSNTHTYIDKSIRFHEEQLRFRRNKRRILACFAIVLATIGGWLTWETRGRLRANGLVQAIFSATPPEAEILIDRELPRLRRWTDKSLQDVTRDPKASVDQRQRASLALLPIDPNQFDCVAQHLLESTLDEFPVISNSLNKAASGDNRQRLKENLWAVFRDPRKDIQQRFRGGMALTVLEHNAQVWTESDALILAKCLLSSNSEHHKQLRDYLAPISDRLRPHLESAFRSEVESAYVRVSAAHALAHYLAKDIVSVARLLIDATPEQYAVLYPVLLSHPDPKAVDFLNNTAATLPDKSFGSGNRVTFGQQRANAAITLLRLGLLERVMPVFAMQDDPEAVTQFVFRCRPLGMNFDSLFQCWRLVSNAPHKFPIHARYALLLAFGEWTFAEIPDSHQEELTTQIASLYRHDPSSGVHAASGWLLRKWGLNDIASNVDKSPVPYSPSREWFRLVIEEESRSQPLSDRFPSRMTLSYTFVVFPKGEYGIDTVKGEPSRALEKSNSGLSHLGPFAILDREITIQEFKLFSRHYDNSGSNSQDAAGGISWYESIAFCRWLGELSGYSEIDQPYASPDQLDRNDFPREIDRGLEWAPRNWIVDQNRPGFRLPSEAEWEAACRAGTSTAFGYGSDASLLRAFGWYEDNSSQHAHCPKELRPNFRGLFDMHGNQLEWTHDEYHSPSTTTTGENSGVYRVRKSGSWGSPPRACRSGHRYGIQPSDRDRIMGFRLAKTLVPEQ